MKREKTLTSKEADFDAAIARTMEARERVEKIRKISEGGKTLPDQIGAYEFLGTAGSAAGRTPYSSPRSELSVAPDEQLRLPDWIFPGDVCEFALGDHRPDLALWRRLDPEEARSAMSFQAAARALKACVPVDELGAAVRKSEAAIAAALANFQAAQGALERAKANHKPRLTAHSAAESEAAKLLGVTVDGLPDLLARARQVLAPRPVDSRSAAPLPHTQADLNRDAARASGGDPDLRRAPSIR